METQKAGCILIDKKEQKLCLVYRAQQNDYSFPKGHLEIGETIKQCAIRETEEETKRVPLIENTIPPIEEHYITPQGEKCVSYLYVAWDNGKSDNQSTDTHPTVWVSFDEVERVLTYPSLINIWKSVLPKVKKLLEIENID